MSKIYIIINKNSSELIANNIIKLIPEGIHSLLNIEPPEENLAHLVILFNCPNSFYLKYSEKIGELKKIAGLSLLTGFYSCNLKMDVDFQENFDLNNFDDVSKINEINKRIEITNLIINHLKNLFEDFKISSEELLDLILNKFAIQKGEDLKKFNSEYYDKMNDKFYVFKNNIYIEIEQHKRTKGKSLIIYVEDVEGNRTKISINKIKNHLI